MMNKDNNPNIEVATRKNKYLMIGSIIAILLIILAFTYYLFLRPKEYNVLFYSDDGTVFLKQSITQNDKIEKPKDPVKEGYIFEYWLLDDQKYDFNSKVTSDVKLKAKWTQKSTEEKVKYEVKFDTDGGSKVQPQYVTANEKVTKPETPKKEGYTFKEWVLNGKTYNFESEVESDLILKAKWQKENNSNNIDDKNNNNNNNNANNNSNNNNNNIYAEQTCQVIVKFNTNGGTPAPNDQVLNIKYKYDPNSPSGTTYSNNIIKKPQDPVKPGYRFMGWTWDDGSTILELPMAINDCHGYSASGNTFQIKSAWERIPVTPILNNQYLGEYTTGTTRYDVYRLSNTTFINENYVESGRYVYPRQWRLYLVSDPVSGYQTDYIKWSAYSPNELNVINYHALFSSTTYQSIYDFSTEYIYVAILKTGNTRNYSFYAKEVITSGIESTQSQNINIQAK